MAYVVQKHEVGNEYQIRAVELKQETDTDILY